MDWIRKNWPAIWKICKPLIHGFIVAVLFPAVYAVAQLTPWWWDDFLVRGARWLYGRFPLGETDPEKMGWGNPMKRPDCRPQEARSPVASNPEGGREDKRPMGLEDF